MMLGGARNDGFNPDTRNQDEIKSLKKDKSEQEKRQTDAKAKIDKLKKDSDFIKNREKSRQVMSPRYPKTDIRIRVPDNRYPDPRYPKTGTRIRDSENRYPNPGFRNPIPGPRISKPDTHDLGSRLSPRYPQTSNLKPET